MGPSTGALAWPWWGRSLPKGNQWECWDPGLGPNVVGLPVHFSPQCTPDTPNSPLTPLVTPMPLMQPIPFLAVSTYTPCQPPIHHWHATPLGAPNAPLCHLYPFWLLSTYTSCQPIPYTPNSPQWSLTPPTPLGTPNAPYATYTLLAPEYLLHASPNTPVTPYTPDAPIPPNSPRCLLHP